MMWFDTSVQKPSQESGKAVDGGGIQQRRIRRAKSGRTMPRRETQPDRQTSRLLGLIAAIPARVLQDIYFGAELLLVAACGIAAKIAYVDVHFGPEPLQKYLLPFMAIVPLMYYVFRARGHYHRTLLHTSDEWRAFGRLMPSLALVFLLLIAIGFLFRIVNDYSRIWLISWFVSATVLVMAARFLAMRVFGTLARAGHLQRRVAICGDASLSRDFLKSFRQANPDARIKGIFMSEETPQAKYPRWVDGGLHDLIKFGQENRLDQIVLVFKVPAKHHIITALDALRLLPAPVELVLRERDLGVPVHDVTNLSGMTLLTLRGRPISDWGVLLKAALDRILSAFGLIAAAPVFLLIALAIKLDSRGPVFFKQRRHGFNHQIITVWKFRTMRVMEDGDTVVQAKRGDDRVTRAGRFLRKTSLDELPQLINVVKGEMSLVGPRPHALAHNDYYAELLKGYSNRHVVKPGITGWAQINGFRGPTENPETMQRRIEYDMYYIENWSIWLDLRILAMTPFLGFVNKNAL